MPKDEVKVDKIELIKTIRPSNLFIEKNGKKNDRFHDQIAKVAIKHTYGSPEILKIHFRIIKGNRKAKRVLSVKLNRSA